jgi:hypothetical protein
MTWNDVLKYVIMGIIALLGSPVTQWLKNQFKLEDRWALALTGVVAAIFALGEMTLAHAIDWKAFNIEQLPAVFGAVFTLATVYYAWLKDSPSKLGAGGLLKKRS